MKSGVYESRNTVSGRHYFGSAVNLRDRKRQHFQRLEEAGVCNEPLQQTYEKSPNQWQYKLRLWYYLKFNQIPGSCMTCDRKLGGENFRFSGFYREHDMYLLICPDCGWIFPYPFTSY